MATNRKQPIGSDALSLARDLWGFRNFSKLQIAEKVLAVVVEQATTTTEHYLLRSLQVHFIQLQQTAAIVAFVGMLFRFFLSHRASTTRNMMYFLD
jgi:hypothetical protein